MACTGAMWRMLRVGRILICVHTTNKDCLLLLLLLEKSPAKMAARKKWPAGRRG